MSRAIVPYTPGQLQEAFGLTLAEANQALVLLNNGLQLYDAIRQIAPAITEDMLHTIERMTQLRPGHDAPGEYEDYFRRERNSYEITNEGEHRVLTRSQTARITENRNRALDRLGMHAEDQNITTPGTFTSQFATWRTQQQHLIQLKNKKQMKPLHKPYPERKHHRQLLTVMVVSPKKLQY